MTDFDKNLSKLKLKSFNICVKTQGFLFSNPNSDTEFFSWGKFSKNEFDLPHLASKFYCTFSTLVKTKTIFSNFIFNEN